MSCEPCTSLVIFGAMGAAYYSWKRRKERKQAELPSEPPAYSYEEAARTRALARKLDAERALDEAYVARVRARTERLALEAKLGAK